MNFFETWENQCSSCDKVFHLHSFLFHYPWYLLSLLTLYSLSCLENSCTFFFSWYPWYSPVRSITCCLRFSSKCLVHQIFLVLLQFSFSMNLHQDRLVKLSDNLVLFEISLSSLSPLRFVNWMFSTLLHLTKLLFL